MFLDVYLKFSLTYLNIVDYQSIEFYKYVRICSADYSQPRHIHGTREIEAAAITAPLLFTSVGPG